MNGGARTWYFPDGYLPEKGHDGKMEAHEALMLMNTREEKIDILLDVYFSESPPRIGIPIKVEPESVRVIRLDDPRDLDGLQINPLTQYALRVRAEKPIVAQFGRLDTTQNNMAYYGTMGFFED